MDDLYTFLLVLPIMVPLWLALGVSGGSYLRSKTGNKLVFRPPLAGMIAAITLPVWMYLMLRLPLTDRRTAILFLQSIPSHPQTRQMLLITGLFIAAIYGLALSLFKAQWFLLLDRDKHFWRSLDISRIPFRIKTGLWSELSGVHVLKIKARATFYVVQLVCSDHACSNPSSLYSTLGKFDTSEAAKQFAGQMAHDLNLPHLPMRSSEKVTVSRR